jgi:hypothetical protein
MLLIVTGGLGIFLIVYSLIRYFTGLHLSEAIEKNLFDTIVFIALGLFLYNRKLASDEKKAREAKERAELEAQVAESDLVQPTSLRSRPEGTHAQAARAEEADENDAPIESEPIGEQTDAETPDTEEDSACPEKTE